MPNQIRLNGDGDNTTKIKLSRFLPNLTFKSDLYLNYSRAGVGLDWKNVLFSIIWRNYIICRMFYGENLLNLVIRMITMEIAWRQCRE